MNIFDKFDIILLNDSNFKEDSVREEIIVPILTKLGYSASGENRIIRSKPLEHPYVQFGTKSQRVNIIPDYLIQIENKLKFVLDAKAPNENILEGKNVEQVYSYAVHREIRSNLYGLCNGKELIVFDINETSPKLHIKISEIDDNWNKIYNVLSPLALTKPYILKFKPDFGFHLKRIGFDSTSEFIFLSFWCNFLGKLSDDKYSLSSYFPFEEQTYCATFQKLLEIIPYDRREKLKQALTNYPFKIGFATKEESINIGVVSRLSPKLEFGRSEAFVPFIIVEFKKKI